MLRAPKLTGALLAALLLGGTASAAPAALCINAVELRLAETAGDLFAVAHNPLAGQRFADGAAYPVSLDIRQDNLPAAIAHVDAQRNPYVISLTAEAGSIVAVNRAAAFFALHSLATTLAADHCGLPPGATADWAGLRLRALHFVLRRVTLKTARQMIDRAVAARFNTVIMGLADAVDIRKDVVPLRSDALTTAEFLELVEYARAYGLEVVPDLPLLTHQQGFFKKRFPELMYNASTYDPRKPRVYELVFRYFDTLIDLIGPRHIVIGHDEVAGLTPASRRKWLAEGEEPLPPELFLQDLETLSQYFEERGVEPWMWGDMLIAREEFPTMHKRNFHGVDGYLELRHQIPANIVILDWHYHHEGADFPTVQAFIDAGHDVIGASWKNMTNIHRFAEYMARTNSHGRGMMAATFWHVQKQQWDMVDQIVGESGRRFWNAGRQEGAGSPPQITTE